MLQYFEFSCEKGSFTIQVELSKSNDEFWKNIDISAVCGYQLTKLEVDFNSQNNAVFLTTQDPKKISEILCDVEKWHVTFLQPNMKTKVL